MRRLRSESLKLKGEIVSVSFSSDPYPNVEAQSLLTRACLEILSRANCKIHVITKSGLVLRDQDLLMRRPSLISFTITTDNDQLASLIEPHADPPSERLRAIGTLGRNGFAIAVRIDPIIPFINDKPEYLVKRVAELGVRHITSSTYKMKPDSWRRLSTAIPELPSKLRTLYFEKGEQIGGCRYLPRSVRTKLMKSLRVAADKYGVRFGTCREGLGYLNTAACDGSWLFRK